ncbi:MAG: hypothetical protein IT243_01920 [Bacteroidia bacterium]|nr:hypothetical protein [Bacteroidia bacterium]
MEQKKILIFISFFMIFINAYPQFELNTGLGFCSSVPIEKRDSFDGMQSFAFSVVPKYYINKNIKVISPINLFTLKISNKYNASEIIWKTASLGIGGEFSIFKNKNFSAFSVFNSGYLFKYGKSVLDQSSSSGKSFYEIKTQNKIFNYLETGISFTPNDFITIKGSIFYPLSSRFNLYKAPVAICLNVYLRNIFWEKNNVKKDTIIESDKNFCKKLNKGILYVIENRKDTSYLTLRKAFAISYKFSKVDFIDEKELSTKLDSFKNDKNFEFIFIAKVGNIVYDLGSASTVGIILYNYKMQNPVEDKPIFVRNLTSDSEFKNLAITNRIVKRFNSRIYNYCKD